MLTQAANMAVYGTIFFSLFIIDYVLGNGFVDMFQKIFCKLTCLVRRTIRDDAKQIQKVDIENPLSLPVLFIEVLVLTFTVMILNKIKSNHSMDRIDELLQESKDALKQTNEFLEKWRLRRVPTEYSYLDEEPQEIKPLKLEVPILHMAIVDVPTEYSYLDEEPQEIKPLKLEVPILHMAIVDTRGTTRTQPERGDAGDTITITDSTLLSVTSLIGDDSDDTSSEEKNEDNHLDINTDSNNRYLWDVMEEDDHTEE